MSVPTLRTKAAISIGVFVVTLAVASLSWYFAAGAESKAWRSGLIGLGATLIAAALAYMTTTVTSWQTEASLDARETDRQRADRYRALVGPLDGYVETMRSFEEIMGPVREDPDHNRQNPLASRQVDLLNALRTELLAAVDAANSDSTEEVRKVLDDMRRILEGHSDAEILGPPLTPLPSAEFRAAAFPRRTAR